MTAKYTSAQSLIAQRYQAATKIQSQFRGHSVRKSETGVQVANLRRPFQEEECAVCHEKYTENPGLKRRVTKCFHQCCEDCVIKMSRAGSLKKCHLCQQENPFTEKEIKLIDPGKGIARLAQRDQDASLNRAFDRFNRVLRVAVLVALVASAFGVLQIELSQEKQGIVPSEPKSKSEENLGWIEAGLEFLSGVARFGCSFEGTAMLVAITWLINISIGFDLQCNSPENPPVPLRAKFDLSFGEFFREEENGGALLKVAVFFDAFRAILDYGFDMKSTLPVHFLSHLLLPSIVQIGKHLAFASQLRFIKAIKPHL